ncbi:MAG: hypothetical protein II596_11830 [Thermoguttaceae bacterium]|nr:hypothetical protein [Thermoguttaceae bacterium]
MSKIRAPYVFLSLFAAVCLSLLALSGKAFQKNGVQLARVFAVNGRPLVIDRPFRPGPAPAAPAPPRAAATPVVPRTAPPKEPSVVERLSPPRIVPHYLPPEGDYTPRHYPGVTVVPIPPQSSYVPNPATSVDLSPFRQNNYPSTIPGPRRMTPSGLRPSHDPFRPDPFDPDVTRRQGYRNF